MIGKIFNLFPNEINKDDPGDQIGKLENVLKICFIAQFTEYFFIQMVGRVFGNTVFLNIFQTSQVNYL